MVEVGPMIVTNPESTKDLNFRYRIFARSSLVFFSLSIMATTITTLDVSFSSIASMTLWSDLVRYSTPGGLATVEMPRTNVFGLFCPMGSGKWPKRMEADRSGYRILDKIVCSSFSMSVTFVSLQFRRVGANNQFLHPLPAAPPATHVLKPAFLIGSFRLDLVMYATLITVITVTSTHRYNKGWHFMVSHQVGGHALESAAEAGIKRGH